MKKVTTMRDSNGNEIPLKYVSKYDKLRDSQTRKIYNRFMKARKALETLMKECIEDLNTLKNCKEHLGEKGNFKARSFDGLIQVEIRQQYNILLDERVAKAREMMLDYVNHILSKVDGADMQALKLIIESAFRANSSGMLPAGKILELLRMEINNVQWREAKMLLQEAIKPQKGKRYLTCEVRPDVQHDFRSIRLDIADCWPTEIKE